MIATVLIVLCHLMQFFNMELAWWFNIGVQLFFVLSGFLYSGKNISDFTDFYKKQIRKILIPYYLYLFIVIPIMIKFAPESMYPRRIIALILCVGEASGLDHFWFIRYILLCYFITPVLDAVKKRMANLPYYRFVVVCLILFIFVNIFGTYYTKFRMDRVSCYLIGYFLGVLSKSYGVKRRNEVWFLISAIAVCCNAVRICINYIMKIPMTGALVTLYGYFENYAHMFLGITLFISMMVIIPYFKISYNRFLKIIDKYSYYIYIVHHIFILGSLSLLSLTTITIVNIAIVLIATILSSIILKNITDLVEKRL